MRLGKLKLTEYSEPVLDELGVYIKWSVGNDMGKRDIHYNLEKRWKLEQRIKDCAVDGKIYVEESGMDCDCVKYWGHVHECKATLMDYYRLSEEINKWADGPFSLHIMSERDRKEVKSGSKDLILEAYEDGHPHVVYCQMDTVELREQLIDLQSAVRRTVRSEISMLQDAKDAAQKGKIHVTVDHIERVIDRLRGLEDVARR